MPLKGWGTIIALLMQSLIAACGFRHTPEPRGPLAERLDELSREAEAGRLGKIEIIAIRPDTEHISAVRQEVLESDWDYRFEIRRTGGSRLADLTRALRTGQAEPATQGADLHWGVIFYAGDDEEKRLGAIYFDITGRRGAIDQTPVTFGRDFFPRIKSALKPPYE